MTAKRNFIKLCRLGTSVRLVAYPMMLTRKGSWEAVRFRPTLSVPCFSLPAFVVSGVIRTKELGP